MMVNRQQLPGNHNFTSGKTTPNTNFLKKILKNKQENLKKEIQGY